MNTINTNGGRLAHEEANGVPLPLPEVIYRWMRINIVSGTLAPGQPLNQEELANHFGVSRVPLREAMNRLEAEGLIVLRPRRGYAVTELDADEIAEIFEMRMVIEEHAGFVATKNRTEQDVHDLEAILGRMQALPRSAPDYFVQWSRLNYEFHTRIFASSRRKRLVRIAGTLRDSVEPYIWSDVRIAGHMNRIQQEHVEIFEAFKAGDAERVALLSRKHCEASAARLLKSMRPKAGTKKTPRAAKGAAAQRS
jgi:DNA-binding GntR family transcriptional regulator